MSLQPQDVPEIPNDTFEVAKAVFPPGNLYLQMREQLGIIYKDHDFVELFSHRGQPAESPWRLVLVCIKQFIDNLSDRQAAAVRARIDWKYVLSLPLNDTGFNFSVLSEFRNRLLSTGKEQELLNLFLTHLKEKGLLKTYHRQRTDATHVLASVRALNRLELLSETVRAALNSLSAVHPDWLAEHREEGWFERYGRRIENYRLLKLDREREALANTIGCDGLTLMAGIYTTDSPMWLREIPAVETLRQVWVQQFYPPNSDGLGQWRITKDMPSSGNSIHSPYDIDARYSNKRSMDWVGYKAHLTEICDDSSPRIITHVHTTHGTVPDGQVVQQIHQELEQKNLLPQEHFMDGGYLSAEHLVNSKAQHQINIIGPIREDHSWQAKAGEGFDINSFQIDWKRQCAICPQGHISTKWQPDQDIHGKAIIKVRFLGKTCRTCPVRSQCTQSKSQPRELTFRPQALFVALNERRKVQNTEEFQQKYGTRAGIESAHS
jgi:transposase